MLFFNIPLCEHSFWCMGVITYDIVLSFPVYLSFNRIHFELFFGFLVLFWRKVHTSKSDVVRLPESITVKLTPHFVFPHFRIPWTNQLSCRGAHTYNCQTLGENKFLSGNVTCSVEFLLFMRDLERKWMQPFDSFNYRSISLFNPFWCSIFKFWFARM
jgi:hypothetical protein